MAHLSEGMLLFHRDLPVHLSLVLSSARGLESVSVLGEGVGGWHGSSCSQTSLSLARGLGPPSWV